MGPEPDEIRREIEETRTDMSETIDAIGYKVDVPSRVRDRVHETTDSIKRTLGMAGDEASDVARQAGDMAEDVGERAREAAQETTTMVRQRGRMVNNWAHRNPLGLLAGSVAAGFVAGLMFPPTRMEMRTVGPMAEDVRERAMEVGREAVERGRVVAQEVMDTAGQTAKEEVREQVEDYKQEHQGRTGAGTGRTTPGTAGGGMPGTRAPGGTTGPGGTPSGGGTMGTGMGGTRREDHPL